MIKDEIPAETYRSALALLLIQTAKRNSGRPKPIRSFPKK